MMHSPSEKHCSKCGQTKPAAEFNRDISRTDNLSVYCSKCMRSYYKPRRPVSLERVSTDRLIEELKRRGIAARQDE